jgi:predicted hotdog family 3-hydroxylacyl-ACP dehydratase
VSGSPLGREWLASHLPHQGAMSLLDSIVSWDESGLRAVASGHRSRSNPLRRGDELPVACAIEYAAQAAAAHGALLASAPSGPGMLVAIRAVDFHAARLDDQQGPLDIAVRPLGGGESGVIYGFDVSSSGRTLATGRLTVAFAR